MSTKVAVNPNQKVLARTIFARRIQGGHLHIVPREMLSVPLHCRPDEAYRSFMISKGRRTRRTLVGLFLVACGGSTKPAEEPTAEPAGETRTESENATDSSEREDTQGPKEAAASSASVSDDERRAIFQLVLDDEDLGAYLHITQPGRFPLKVSGKDLPTGLTKASKPVEYVDSPPPKAPVLIFTEVQINNKHASATYRYEIEGIQGTTTLEKGPHGWEILRSRIVEHFRADKDK